HVRSGVGRGWGDLLGVPAQILSSLVSPRSCSVEIRVVDLLGHEYDVEATPSCAARSSTSSCASSAPTPAGCQQRQFKNQKTGFEFLKELLHCLFLSFIIALNFLRQDAVGLSRPGCAVQHWVPAQ